jgi:hypothetical protein
LTEYIRKEARGGVFKHDIDEETWECRTDCSMLASGHIMIVDREGASCLLNSLIQEK